MSSTHKRSTIERKAREHKTHTNTESTESTNNPLNQKEGGSQKEWSKANSNRTAIPETRAQALPSCASDSSASPLQKKKTGRHSAATWMFPMSYCSAMMIGYTLDLEAFSLPVTAAWNPPGSPGRRRRRSVSRACEEAQGETRNCRGEDPATAKEDVLARRCVDEIRDEEEDLEDVVVAHMNQPAHDALATWRSREVTTSSRGRNCPRTELKVTHLSHACPEFFRVFCWSCTQVSVLHHATMEPDLPTCRFIRSWDGGQRRGQRKENRAAESRASGRSQTACNERASRIPHQPEQSVTR